MNMSLILVSHLYPKHRMLHSQQESSYTTQRIPKGSDAIVNNWKSNAPKRARPLIRFCAKGCPEMVMLSVVMKIVIVGRIVVVKKI
mmetsp:Transcript_12000/g.16626  ORF Transcript_12000/g.16626 Transcript_12000/m.16626 type:complete len:86 (+) Transcript_12000:200-457(+)